MTYHGARENISKLYFEFIARGDIFLVEQERLFSAPAASPDSLSRVSL